MGRSGTIKLTISSVFDEKGTRAAERAMAGFERSMAKMGAESTLASSLAAQSVAIEQYGQKWVNAGNNISSVGRVTSAIGATIVGAGVAAYSAFVSVDKGADIAIRKTGATGAAADALRKSFETVALNAPGDFEAVGNAVGSVQSRFKLTGTELENVSEDFLKFANVTSMDVDTAITQADKTMSIFGIDASQTDSVLGLLLTTSQNTGIGMSDLMSSVQSNGATFQEMGLNISQSVGLMGMFEESGYSSEQMLVGLKKASVNYAKEGVNMSDGLNSLISRLQNTSTQADATKEAIKIFGARAGMTLVEAAKSGKINLGGLSGDLSSYAGVVDSTRDATLDGSNQMQLAWKTAQIAGSKFGSTIADTVGPGALEAANALTGLASGFANMDEGGRRATVTAAAVAAGLLLGVPVAAKVVTGIGHVIQAYGSVVGRIAAFVASKAAESAATTAATAAETASTASKTASTVATGASAGAALTDAAAKTDEAAANTAVAASSAAMVGPMLLAAAGVVMVAVAIGSYVQQQQDLENATTGVVTASYGMQTSISANTTALDEGSKSVDNYGEKSITAAADVSSLIKSQAQFAQSMTQTNNSANANIAMLEGYKQTIDGITASGNYSSENIAKLKLAVDGLNTACGTNYSVDAETGAIRDQNGAVVEDTKAIDNLIDAKKREAQTDALKSEMSEGYKKQSEAATTLAQAQKHLADVQDESYKNSVIAKDGQAAYDVELGTAQNDVKNAQSAYDSMTTAIMNLAAQQTILTEVQQGNAGAAEQFAASHADFEAAVMGANVSLTGFCSSLDQAGISTEQLNSLTGPQLQTLLSSYDGTTQSITDAMNRMASDATSAGAQAGSNWATGLSSEQQNAVTAAAQIGGMSEDQLVQMANAAGYTGAEGVTNFANGMLSQASQSYNAGATNAEQAHGGLGSQDGSGPGQNMASTYTGPLFGSNAYGAGASMASGASSGAYSQDGSGAGDNFASGFVNTVSSWIDAARRAGEWLVQNAIAGANAAQDAHSPSRVMGKSGDWFSQGFINHVNESASAAYAAGAELTGAAIAGANSNSASAIGIASFGSLGTSAASNAAQSSKVDDQMLTEVVSIGDKLDKVIVILEQIRDGKLILASSERDIARFVRDIIA